MRGAVSSDHQTEQAEPGRSQARQTRLSGPITLNVVRRQSGKRRAQQTPPAISPTPMMKPSAVAT